MNGLLRFHFTAWQTTARPGTGPQQFTVELVLEAAGSATICEKDRHMVREYISARCHGQHLREQFGFEPTPENLARHFYQWASVFLPVRSVRLRERAGTGERWVEYPAAGHRSLCASERV